LDDQQQDRSGGGARVLVVSLREVRPSVSRCLLYEFEDLICRIDDAVIAVPQPGDVPPRWRIRMASRLHRLFGTRSTIPQRRRCGSNYRYDLLFLPCEGITDLLLIGSLDRWLQSARVRVCYVAEVWRAGILNSPYALSRLRKFDRIFTACHGSVEELRKATGRPCDYLPPAVDAVSFCPFPEPTTRDIDVYNMGRRASELHKARLDCAAKQGLVYLYDEFGGNPKVDAREHRQSLANRLKRTRFLITYSAKLDCPGQTLGQEEVGYRFFEGAAAGAVMVGRQPKSAVFGELMGWPDAVVELADDPACVGDVLHAIDAMREERIRRTNVRGALLQHDWVYRWKTVLDAVGLPPLPAVEVRKERLHEMTGSVVSC